MDRRSFLALLAGSFTLNLLPGVAAKEAVKRAALPPFDPSKIKWLNWVPWVDQAVTVRKGIIHVVHTCACGREFHGIHTSAVVKEDAFTTIRTFRLDQEEAMEQAAKRMEEIWNETRESGLVRHEGCPLQPDLKMQNLKGERNA